MSGLIHGGTIVNHDHSRRGECKGVPRTVLSRGRVAWELGDMRAKPGSGDFMARQPNPPVHVANAIWKGLTQPKPVQRVEVTP
jgi:dihydropyrimidinase